MLTISAMMVYGAITVSVPTLNIAVSSAHGKSLQSSDWVLSAQMVPYANK